MTKYILSVDGGGIRGIIPAIILAEIESRTKKLISQIFDLMAGTSTGGIIVARLCKSNKLQYSANDLVELLPRVWSIYLSIIILEKINCFLAEWFSVLI